MTDLEKTLQKRSNISFFREDKVPEKSLIDEILDKAHILTPHKNNFWHYEIEVYGPEHKEEKKYTAISTVCSTDRKYYKGLGCKDVRIMRSMMIPDGLDSQVGSPYKDGILLGGNFVSWYGGMDSYLVASEVNEQKYGVSMGRKQEQEDLIDDIKYLPYMSWREWINHIGQYKVGVHMMRTHAAGTFSMNMSWHGTPVIGYKGLDTQDLLHPQTTVEVGDLVGARKIMKRLYENQDFYDECSEQTENLFEKYYSEDAWMKHWRRENETY